MEEVNNDFDSEIIYQGLLLISRPVQRVYSLILLSQVVFKRNKDISYL